MTHHRGLTFTQTAIAMAAYASHGAASQALEAAERRWGWRSGVVNLLKSAVEAATTQDDPWAGSLVESNVAQAEFLEMVRPMTILGKMADLRRVPFRTPVVRQSTGGVAYWVGEGKAKNLTAAAFDRASLTSCKVTGLMVVSDELLKTQSIDAELILRNDLLAATAELTDSTFIDPANGGTAGEKPAAITNGATTITSQGVDAAAIRADITAAIAAYSGKLSTAVWIMHPKIAVAIGLAMPNEDIGARGGTLAGLPAITSESVPFLSDGSILVLADASAVLLAEEGIRATKSTQSTVQMDNDPAEPTASGTVMVSLWQRNSTGLLVERGINWELGRSGAVVVVADVDYAG